MIELTVAQIAEIVGGELADISAGRGAAAPHVTGTVEFDSRAVTPGGLFLALPGARDRRPRPRRAAAIAAGAVAVLAARPVGVPAIVVRAGGRRRTSGSRWNTIPTVPARQCWPRWPKLAAAVAAATGGRRADDRRGDRFVGQDLDEGPAGRRAAPRWATVVAPPGSFNNELGHPWTGAARDRGHRLSDAGDVGAPSRQHRRAGGDRHPAIAVVLNVGTAHLGEFGSRQAIADTKAELPQAVPESGVVILNVDDAAVAAMAQPHRRPGGAGQSGRPRGTAMSGPMRSPSTSWPGRVSPCTRGDERRPGAAGRARRASGLQRAVRGRGRPGVRCHPRAGGRRTGRRRSGVGAPDGGDHPRPTASPSSTTPTTPTPTRCAPGWRRWRMIGAGPAAAARAAGAVLGEMAELGDDAISEHDRIGRLAVRLDVSRLVVVGTGRAMSAMHHGAVMEGSWGSEASPGRRRRRGPGVAARRTAPRRRGAGQGVEVGRPRPRSR